jgi:hypothetical protein
MQAVAVAVATISDRAAHPLDILGGTSRAECEASSYLGLIVFSVSVFFPRARAHFFPPFR